jgi:branched-chain amino acid transport system permease protein
MGGSTVDQPARPLSRYAMLVAALAALGLFLLFADNTFNGYRLQLVTLVGLNAIVAVSLALTSGFTGVFSLGQIGFYAIGAYVGALLAIPPQGKGDRFLPGLPGWLANVDLTGLHPQVALLVACLGGGEVAAVIAAIVGAPLMRLSGHYVAVATMGFLIITNSVLINWNDVTRGARGLNQIPTTTNIWVAFAWALVALYVVLRIRFSAYGRSMIASRENIIAAQAAGIPVLQTRLLAFVVGAFFTGVAGALFAHQLGTITPSAFYFTQTFNVVIMVVLGGMGSATGAVTGAVFMTLAPDRLRGIEDGFELGPISAGAHFGLSQIILALTFVLVMIFRPNGLFGDRESPLRWPGRSRADKGEPPPPMARRDDPDTGGTVT